MSDNIHVAVRMRPLITRERESKSAIHWKAEGSSIHQTHAPSVYFNFDRVFQGIDTNEIIYEEFCAPIVQSVIDGFNGTIFAYGQTSSGKTFTMMGNDDGEALGIIHYTISDIFNHIQDMPDREFLLRVSYMEIYNEMVVDLLTDKSENLKLKEDKYGHIKVNGLTEHIVQEADQVLALMRKGEKKRRVGETLMNERSSRSHSIFQVIIESGIRGDEDAAVNVSHFNLVDLAGSERARQTGAKGARLKESININKSLLMLSQVISQLSERVLIDQYINYRDSKLTRILQNSLGGNARTAIICTVTPASLEETISTLKFATRAKSIKNKPQVNEVLTEQALLKRYANEIKLLTKELETTKEEKAQQNKHLQEQILSLRNKFVSQMGPNCTKRTTRRETWGGCLDAARLRISFGPRKLLTPSYEDMDNNTNQKRSCTSDKFSAFDKDPIRMGGSMWNNPLPDLPTVDEENESCFDALETKSSFHSRYSKCLPEGPNSVSSITDATVQTNKDLQLPASNMMTPKSEKIKDLHSVIKSLENELAETREFTTLEMIMARAQNRSSLGLSDGLSKTKVEGKNRETLLTETGTPQRTDSRFSIGDDSIIFKNDSCLLENHSSTPLQSSFEAVSSNIPRSEGIKLDKFKIPLEAIQKGNLLVAKVENKKLANKKEELFQYLGNTIKILSNGTEINSISKTGELNEQDKVLLLMFYMVLHYQCSKLGNDLAGDLSIKMVEISECLNEIFCHFSDQSFSSENMEDKIETFMNKTNILLKDIEMFSLDMNCGKSSVNLLPIENSNKIRGFESSDVINTSAKSPEILCVKKSTIEKAINTTMDYLQTASSKPEELKSYRNNAVNTSIDYPQTVGSNSDELDVDFFKTRIASLEKDIETYLKTISELKEDVDSKNDQVASLEDEMNIQSEIIDCLKEELSVKSNEMTYDKAAQNACHTGLTLTDCSCQTSFVDERGETNKTKALGNVCQSGLEIADGSCQTSFLDEREETDKAKDSLSLTNSLNLPETAGINLQTQIDNTLLQVKISTLEREIETNEKVISDLKYGKDLKDKQVTLFQDKVLIQEKIIERLEEELSLNSLENVTKQEPEISGRIIPVSFVDGSSQTYFMDQLSLFDHYPEEMNDKCKIKVAQQKCSESLEKPSADSLTSGDIEDALSVGKDNSLDDCNTKAGLDVSLDCSKPKCTVSKSSAEPNAQSLTSNDIKDLSPVIEDNSLVHCNARVGLGATLKDLNELKMFVLEFMEGNMEKEYLGEVNLPKENEDSSVQNKIKAEVNTLKEMMGRLEFYLKNKSESYEYFQNVLQTQALELLSLQGKFADVESKLQKTEVEYKDLDETLSDLQNVVSAFVEKCDAPRHFEWKDPVVYQSKASKRVLMLQKINQILEFFVQEKNLFVKEVEAENLQKSFENKLTKSVQTTEDDQLLKVSEELAEFKIEHKDLLDNISNLKLKIEKANRAKEEIECKYKEKEISYKKEIESLKSKFESEKCSSTTKALKCVQTVEEKCDQMLIDQENKFYGEIDGINEQHRRQVQEKTEYHNAEMAKVTAEHKHDMVELKNEHLKKVADIQDKLSKVIEEHYTERRKLEDDICCLRKEVLIRTEMCNKFKQKYKEYAAEMKRLAIKTEKSTRDSAVQANILEQINEKRVTSSINKGTQLGNIKFPKQFLVECDFCAQCIIILKSRLQKQESDPDPTEDSICCKRLQNELETKKAKIITLTRNNETLVKETVALNKELSAKMVLLRSCQCRTIPRVIGNSGQNKQETLDKKKDSHHSTDKNGEGVSSKLRKEIVFTTEADVLRSDLVQRAIVTAVEEERLKLSDNGPASVMVNCVLKRELNLKDKEIKNLKKELAELKIYAPKRNTVHGNENIPIKGPDFEEKELTIYTQAKHPYPLGVVPKLQTKQILKERNKGSQLGNNPLAAIVEKKDTVCENPISTLKPSNVDVLEVPVKTTDRNLEKKRLVEKTKHEVEMFSSGAPECKQQ